MNRDITSTTQIILEPCQPFGRCRYITYRGTEKGAVVDELYSAVLGRERRLIENPSDNRGPPGGLGLRRPPARRVAIRARRTHGKTD